MVYVTLGATRNVAALDATTGELLWMWRPQEGERFDNAPRKGGRRPLLQMLRQARDLESWQLHVSGEGGEDNAPQERIANIDDGTPYWLKVSANADGSFTVTNPRTGVVKAYSSRPDQAP